MPAGLHRSYGAHHLHFITCSCYRRLGGWPILSGFSLPVSKLGVPRSCVLCKGGYDADGIMRFYACRPAPQLRCSSSALYHLFLLSAVAFSWHWTTKKRREKLRYMHRNPVKRGLVESPEQWRWSSYRFYCLGESDPVRINEGWGEISFRNRVA